MKRNRLKSEPPLFEAPLGKTKMEPMRNAEGHVLECCPNCFQTGKIITVEKTVKKTGRKEKHVVKVVPARRYQTYVRNGWNVQGPEICTSCKGAGLIPNTKKGKTQ